MLPQHNWGASVVKYLFQICLLVVQVLNNLHLICLHNKIEMQVVDNGELKWVDTMQVGHNA
jgi:hypothetical protein